MIFFKKSSDANDNATDPQLAIIKNDILHWYFGKAAIF